MPRAVPKPEPRAQTGAKGAEPESEFSTLETGDFESLQTQDKGAPKQAAQGAPVYDEPMYEEGEDVLDTGEFEVLEHEQPPKIPRPGR